MLFGSSLRHTSHLCNMFNNCHMLTRMKKGCQSPLALAQMEWVLSGPFGNWGKLGLDITQTWPIINSFFFFSKIKSNHKFNFSLSPSLYHNHLFILTFIFLFLMKVSFTRSKFLNFSLIWVYFCLIFRTFYNKNGLLVFLSNKKRDLFPLAIHEHLDHIPPY